jgi:glycosyltransferase involved in cell wall biosynthesis
MSESGLVLAQPSRQHAERAAQGLYAHGLLAAYWSGTLPRGDGIPKALRHWSPWGRLVPKLAQHLFPHRMASRIMIGGYRLFDRQVASWVERRLVAGVLGYEVSARRSFETCARSGRLSILDAASVHYLAQRRAIGALAPEAPLTDEEATKRCEIDTADILLTLSNEARRTYVEAGVPAGKVHVLAPGVDASRFRPRSRSPRSGPVRFVFAGAYSRRKGLDRILRAIESLRREGLEAELHLAGSRSPAEADLVERLPTWIVDHGRLASERLAVLFADSDCLLLLSSFEGFGLVVTEALACGTPVVVSERVGAKDFVAEGATGWIVPESDDRRLADRLAHCVRHRESLEGMRERCRARVEKETWERYGDRLAEIVREELARKSRSMRSGPT